MVEMFIVDGLAGLSPRLAVAPFCEVIKEGDLVVMEGEGQRFRHALTDSITVSGNDEFFEMISKLMGKEVLRAYGKYNLKEFNWEEGENE